MFIKTTTAAIVLTGLFATSQVNATEVSLEQLVGSLVSQAVSVTKQEISYNVQEAVLTANHNIDYNSDSQSYVAKVTITDLQQESTEIDVQSDKSE